MSRWESKTEISMAQLTDSPFFEIKDEAFRRMPLHLLFIASYKYFFGRHIKFSPQNSFYLLSSFDKKVWKLALWQSVLTFNILINDVMVKHKFWIAQIAAIFSSVTISAVISLFALSNWNVSNGLHYSVFLYFIGYQAGPSKWIYILVFFNIIF